MEPVSQQPDGENSVSGPLNSGEQSAEVSRGESQSSETSTAPATVSRPVVVSWDTASPVASHASAETVAHQPTADLATDTPSVRPVPVVRVLSPTGVAYVFMTISLFTAAIGLASALLALVNGKLDFAVLAFPVSLLVPALPIFAILFLHLKRRELGRPELALDPSKRRSTQFTQILSFLICLFTLVGVVFSIFAKLGGQSGVPVVKALLDGLVLEVVFGGLLAYYWHDEQRAK